jgi:AcrR family transcriptional regulator
MRRSLSPDTAPRRAPITRGTARDAILQAAAGIAREEGLTALVVDRISAAASVSKGAFFHHFATRRDMVLALIEQVSALFEEDLQRRFEAGGSFARALVDTTIDHVERDPGMIVTLVTAVVLDRTLGPAIEQRLADLHARMLADGSPEVTATLIRAALDGALMHLIVRAGQPADPLFVANVRLALERALADPAIKAG